MDKSAIPKLTISHHFSRVKNTGLASRGLTVFTEMSANAAIFTASPVPMATLKQDVDDLTASTAAATDGGKKDIARRNKDRHTLEQDLTLLGAYVTKVANGDPAILALSGFVAASKRTRTVAQPLDQPSIDSLEQGNTGELKAASTSVRKARSYDYRYAALVNGTPAIWITVTTTTAQPPVTISGLTPGVIYAVQVRALGKLGHTDWSDSATRMCI